MPNNKFSQISLFDIYEDVNASFTEKKSELVSLLEKHIDFSSLISYVFRHTFYSTFGRKHKYHLVSFIKALVIQKLFAFSYDSQLILVLKCSDELRNFCGFDSVPDVHTLLASNRNTAITLPKCSISSLRLLNLSAVKLMLKRLII